jgi:hypothetical protein
MGEASEDQSHAMYVCMCVCVCVCVCVCMCVCMHVCAPRKGQVMASHMQCQVVMPSIHVCACIPSEFLTHVHV